MGTCWAEKYHYIDANKMPFLSKELAANILFQLRVIYQFGQQVSNYTKLMCNRPEGSPHPSNTRNAIFNCYAAALSSSMHNLLFSRKNLSTGRRNRLVNDYYSLLLLPKQGFQSLRISITSIECHEKLIILMYVQYTTYLINTTINIF